MTKPEIADMIDQFVKHVDNCLAWDIARQKHGQAAKDGCLSELQAEALTNADYNSTMAKTALLLSGKLLAPELDRYGEDSAIFRGLLNSIDALDTTYESACGRGVGIRICNSGIDRLNVVHESWPNVKIQLEIIAARFRCIEDEPADTKDNPAKETKSNLCSVGVIVKHFCVTPDTLRLHRKAGKIKGYRDPGKKNTSPFSYDPVEIARIWPKKKNK